MLFVLTNSRPKEATDLLDAGVVKANEITRTVFNQTHGFACCSARQCVQNKNSGSDSDCVSFLATNVSFFGRGFWYSQFWLLQAGFLGPSDCPFWPVHFFWGNSIDHKKGSATRSTSNLKLECDRARIGKNMQRVPVRLFSDRWSLTIHIDS